MRTAVDIYKLLPKTNCGTCGMPTCFGFAAKVSARLASIADCSSLSASAREALQAGEQDGANAPGTVYGQALESLKPKIRALDFLTAGDRFGATVLDSDTLVITFLNQDYRVTRDRVLDASGNETRPWIAILIYNHLCMPDPPRPSGEWITFGSVPASHAKDKAWAAHVEAVIAARFAGDLQGLRSACEKLGGRPSAVQGSHDAAYEFRFFPHYPALLLFHEAVPDENFPADCKLLLDRHAPRYLDIESMVVLGEEFAGRLCGGS